MPFVTSGFPRSEASRTRRGWLGALVLAAGAAATVWWAVGVQGIGLSPDSANYFSAADSVRAGDGFLDFTGEPYVLWPPLYPLLLAGLAAVGLGLEDAATLVNGVAFAALVGMAWTWAWGTFSSRLVAAVAVVGVALSPALWHVHAVAWSEMLFSALALASVLVLGRHLANRDGWRLLLAAALLAGAACVTRYTGPAVVLAGGAALLLTPGASFRARVREAIVWGVVAGTPLAVWLWRNHDVAGTLTGPRFESPYSLRDNVESLLGTVGSWLAGGPYPLEHARVSQLIGAALGLLVLWAVVRAVRRGAERVIPVAMLAAVYPAFLVWSTTTVASDAVGQRFLAPLVAPLLLTVGWLLDDLAGRGTIRRLVVAVVLGAGVALGFATAWDEIRDTRETGFGYAQDRWRDSDLLKWVRTNEVDEPVVSNVPAVVYVHARVRATQSPRRRQSGTELRVDDRPAFEKMLRREGEASMIWLRPENRRGYLFLEEELATRYDFIEEQIPPRDGTLFTVRLR